MQRSAACVLFLDAGRIRRRRRCLLSPAVCSKEFGGGLFALAASVVADLIHHDPLVYRTLDEAGLPQVGGLAAPARLWCSAF